MIWCKYSVLDASPLEGDNHDVWMNGVFLKCSFFSLENANRKNELLASNVNCVL